MSFVCLLLYLFCTIIRPQDWLAGFYGLSLVNYLAIATIFFLAFERLSSKQGLLMKVPQNSLIWGFFASILMSHIVHTYFAGLIFAFNDFVVIFILFFLVLNTINTEKKFKIALWFIVLLILLLVPQCIYQMKYGYGWAGQPITYERHTEEFRVNWIGIFSDPNDLALLFVVAVGVCITFFFGRKKNFFTRILNLGFLIGLFYGIFLTNSRGGFLALAATVYFYFVKRTNRLVLGGIIGGLGTLALFAIGPSRLGLISTQEASASSRVDLWYEGILLIKSNPIFGVGYDRFMEALPQTAHNSFVLAASELGFVGLFFFMALIYSSYKGLTIVMKNDLSLYNYALALQSSLIGFSVAAFFLSRTYVVLPYLLFALSGSLMYIAKQKNKELDFRFTKKDVKITAFLSVGVLVAVYIIIKTRVL